MKGMIKKGNPRRVSKKEKYQLQEKKIQRQAYKQQIMMGFVPGTKKYSQFLHAKKRFMERLGLEIDEFSLNGLVTKIQKGRCTLISQPSNRINKYKTTFLKIPISVIYDKQRKSIVTIWQED